MTVPEQFRNLFEPIKIGSMTVKNRFVMPPMGSNLADSGGYVTDDMLAYYEAKGRGGAGLVIVEVTSVEHPRGSAVALQLAIDDDKYMPGLTELASAIKRGGARACMQLVHAGGARRSVVAGLRSIAPSPIPRVGTEIPDELTVGQIKELEDKFVRGAERAARAGFDAIDLHAAHYYLMAQFLSAEWNRRRDDYGGDLENRARFTLEVVRGIRGKLGRDFPLWCRINGVEYGLDHGTTLEEGQLTARMLEDAGTDAVDVSACGRGPVHASAWPMGGRMLPPMAHPAGTLIPVAEAIKRKVGIPVMAVGSITPEVGQAAIARGQTDMIVVGRGLVADPELPNKVAAGRLDDIIPCIACLRCRNQVVEERKPIACSVNAAAGNERRAVIKPVSKPKKVLVVGAGPAGMEAARVAAMRGHHVTLAEKDRRLGGQLILAAAPPHKQKISTFTPYLARQLDKLGVRVMLDTEATPELVEKLKPDALVIATGGTPIRPDIPGADRMNVVIAEEVLSGKAKVGKRVVVIGGELVGCETAEYLAEQGKQVIITRRGPGMATKIGIELGAMQLQRLAALKVRMLPGVKYVRITEKGLLVVNPEGKEELLEADTIVLAAGAIPNDSLSSRLRGKVSEIHVAGDCVQPRGIMEAVGEGFKIGAGL